jgi:hypothetical protein
VVGIGLGLFNYIVPHLNAELFACGSMVLIDYFVYGFPRVARKTIHSQEM